MRKRREKKNRHSISLARRTPHPQSPHLDLGDKLDGVVPDAAARRYRRHLHHSGPFLLDRRRRVAAALDNRGVVGVCLCRWGRCRRSLGLCLGGTRGGSAFTPDPFPVGGPEQVPFAGSVESPSVVRNSQVAPFASLGVGGPTRWLAVGIIQHQVGVCLVGQGDADVLAALVDHPGFPATQLEDGEVAVGLQHQARGVVGRADELVDEQRLARGEVREARVLGLVGGPRHFWGCERESSVGCAERLRLRERKVERE